MVEFKPGVENFSSLLAVVLKDKQLRAPKVDALICSAVLGQIAFRVVSHPEDWLQAHR